MTDQAKIKAMQEMLEAVITINEVITGIHNLPILEKLNKRNKKRTIDDPIRQGVKMEEKLFLMMAAVRIQKVWYRSTLTASCKREFCQRTVEKLSRILSKTKQPARELHLNWGAIINNGERIGSYFIRNIESKNTEKAERFEPVLPADRAQKELKDE